MSEKLLPTVPPKMSLAVTNFEELQSMAKLFVASGLYEPTDKEEARGITQEKLIARAAIKILAGAEYGLTPFRAMKSLHEIKGKVTPAYQLILSKIRQTPGYDWKLIEWTHDGAEIEITRGGESIGKSRFDKDDAARAGLAGNLWVKYRRNMMMSKAASNAANCICPEIFDGPTYTPEDFGVIVDAEEEEAQAQEAQAQEEKPRPKRQSAKSAEAGAKAQSVPVNATASAESPASTGAPGAANSAPLAAAKTQVTTSAPAAEATEQSTASAATTSTEGPPDVLDVEEISQEAVAEATGQRPGEDQWNQVIAAGIDAGLDEDKIEDICVQLLQEKGVNTESQDTIMAEWTFEIVEELVNALIEAGEQASNG